MRSTFTTAALSALVYSTLTSATVQRTCQTSDICFSIAVPESAASSGSGNLYFQIEGPTSYSWIALGTGQQMSGSNMFIMYTDGSGNVTISPRLGTNHVMPTEDTSSNAADLTLLAGSGVDGNTMRANVLCTNCDKWDGGEMSLSSTSASWIAAWKSGSSLDTTSKSASIQQHDEDPGSFTVDLTGATVSSDSNPFVAASGNSSSGGDSSSGSSGSSGSGSTGSDSGSGSSSGGISQNTSSSQTPHLIAAHGIIMAITFVIMYPIGSILMPLLGKWAIHAAWQIVSFLLMWAGFGLGVVVAQRTFYNFSATHTQLGTVVVVLMVAQPALGFIHHRRYLATQRRTLISTAHLAYGRILMALGVINGGLGLRLAGASHSLITAYSVVAAIIAVAYLAVKLFTHWRQRKAGNGVAKVGSNGTTGRRDKYSQAQGEDIELPRHPNGNE
ncbi:hypothetical protein SCAR479_02007 [Seiridium cardinale]|uniref:DOMON domain-containing protein n=1 Tax=Seiridium cardinale TaxID=138064 RepID=A0ABR2Y407_9PEZI